MWGYFCGAVGLIIRNATVEILDSGKDGYNLSMVTIYTIFSLCGINNDHDCNIIGNIMVSNAIGLMGISLTHCLLTYEDISDPFYMM